MQVYHHPSGKTDFGVILSVFLGVRYLDVLETFAKESKQGRLDGKK